MNHVYIITHHSLDLSEVIFVCNSLLKSKFLLKHRIHELFPWLRAEDIEMTDDGVSLFDMHRFEITKWEVQR